MAAFFAKITIHLSTSQTYKHLNFNVCLCIVSCTNFSQVCGGTYSMEIKCAMASQWTWMAPLGQLVNNTGFASAQ